MAVAVYLLLLLLMYHFDPAHWLLWAAGRLEESPRLATGALLISAWRPSWLLAAAFDAFYTRLAGGSLVAVSMAGDQPSGWHLVGPPSLPRLDLSSIDGREFVGAGCWLFVA